MGECRLSENITTKVEIGGEEVIHNLAPRWQELCEDVRSTPFQRPEWIAAYVRAFERTSEVVLATASAGGRLVAVLPMVRKRCFYAGVPLVKLAGTANSHSVQFDILRSAGAIGEESIYAIWDLLRRTPGWHVLELPLFPQNGVCADLMALAGQDGYPTVTLLVQNSPVLRLRVNGNGAPAQLVSGPSRHFRHELRRYARILAEQAGGTPKVTRCCEASPQLLQRFYDLEASGWKGREGSAINCQPETRAFYDEIARVGAERGYFCLHSLAANGTMAAAAFSVVTRDCFFPMKIAYNEALRRGGPGHLLFSAIVAECADRQIPALFFGGTEEHYKTLWTQETLPLLDAFVFSSDLRSQLAYHVRKNLLSPLGGLQRVVRGRFAHQHGAHQRRPDSVVATKKSGFEDPS